MGAMVTNHVYNKKHITTENLLQSHCHQTTCKFLLCPSVYVCESAGYSNHLQEHVANHYINKQFNQ